jgi:hypothetical protein
MAAGEITQEMMDARLGRMKAGMKAASVARVISHWKGKLRSGLSPEEYKKAEMELWALAAEGAMTKVEVEGLLAQLHAVITDKKVESSPDWEAIVARIEGAVKSGDMTRAEADEKLKGIKQRMGGEKSDKIRERTRERTGEEKTDSNRERTRDGL